MRCVLFESSSTIRIRRFALTAEPETDSTGGESVPETGGKHSAAIDSFMIEE
jgi:hypothetical protein